MKIGEKSFYWQIWSLLFSLRCCIPSIVCCVCCSRGIVTLELLCMNNISCAIICSFLVTNLLCQTDWQQQKDAENCYLHFLLLFDTYCFLFFFYRHEKFILSGIVFKDHFHSEVCLAHYFSRKFGKTNVLKLESVSEFTCVESSTAWTLQPTQAESDVETWGLHCHISRMM